MMINAEEDNLRIERRTDGTSKRSRRLSVNTTHTHTGLLYIIIINAWKHHTAAQPSRWCVHLFLPSLPPSPPYLFSTALLAYSTWKRRPSGEKVVGETSYPAPVELMALPLFCCVKREERERREGEDGEHEEFTMMTMMGKRRLA